LIGLTCCASVKVQARASAEKFSGGRGAMKKRPKNSKKTPKIALLNLYLLYLFHV